jgi:peptidyl-prolyl cis-trans isomerase A (cyclophilin A)
MRNKKKLSKPGLGRVLVLLAVLSGCSTDKKFEKAPEPARKKPSHAPAQFYAKLNTSKGDVMVEVVREWAPRGADRFYELVNAGFYDGSRFYRVLRGFAAQFGISKDVKANELWRQLLLPDDPVKQSNRRGYLSFATRGPSTRSTQVFINLRDNRNLDGRGFAPFGRVVEGLEIVDKLYAGYGEVMTLGGSGPDPAKLEAIGDEYAERSFPRLDLINSAKVIEYTPKAEPAAAKKAAAAKKTR